MNHPSPHRNRRGALIAAAMLTLVFIGGIVFLWSYDVWYQGKIMPGVMMGKRIVGSYSPEYTDDMLEAYRERLRLQGAVFSFKGKNVTLYSVPTTLNADIPIQTTDYLFDINSDATIASLMAVGRTGSLQRQHVDRMRSAIAKTSIAPVITIDRQRVIDQLKKEFSFFHTPATNARFATDEKGAITITPETRGIEFDYDKALASLAVQLSSLEQPTIHLDEGATLPDITTRDLESVRSGVEQLIAEPLEITFENKESDPPQKRAWTLSGTLLLSWVKPQRSSGGQAEIQFDRGAISDYLKEKIAPDVRVDVVHPRFEMKNGRVVAFDIPRDGRELDSEKTADVISASLTDRRISAQIVVRTIQSPFRQSADSEPVIKELLSRAETDFSGSSKNRVANIARGAELINGILLAPGEEFSTNKALGDVDAAHGFFPGLVIKGTETVPEYGGGLCQVSTTLFRAVAFAGLEVRERRNHSYRVSFYEPPVGFDATIYGTSPDFRFKNDTPSHLLIQARTVGNKMIVEFWGSKDGRTVEVDTPRVFNIKKAGPPKLIETDELAPGEKNCTEKAHNGADAVFERRITYADGTTKKETYKSHYVVWPAVCLIGKAKEDPPPPDSSAQENTSSSAQAIFSDSQKQESAPTQAP
ncbi:VanW family protein [Candidatus Uhrbacteria bacterium]|nr:VanW family protein [Candidatus Uhrbacteria bacterium]